MRDVAQPLPPVRYYNVVVCYDETSWLAGQQACDDRQIVRPEAAVSEALAG